MTTRLLSWLPALLLWAALFLLLFTHGNDRSGWALLLGAVLSLAAVFSMFWAGGRT